ncbi:MAG TPA: hypothetical protein VLD84_07750 [Nitrososphaeraceae archaeon]|nr:hypothetical protein [Nitrososphaeraceae archaeon]
MSNNEGYYSAQFKPSDGLHKLPKEHCSANLNHLKMIGKDLYQQVRLELPTTNAVIPAIYTVGKVHEEKSDLVYVGKKIEEFVKCLKTHNTNPCKGKVKADLTKDLNENDARLQGEFIEQLTDNGQNQKLVVIAPHGGEIENKTDKQAEIVRHEIHLMYLCGFVKVLIKRIKVLMNGGILLLRKLTKNRFPCLVRFMSGSLNMQLPSTVGLEIIFALEDVRITKP